MMSLYFLFFALGILTGIGSVWAGFVVGNGLSVAHPTYMQTTSPPPWGPSTPTIEEFMRGRADT